jgi:hypothetical protein
MVIVLDAQAAETPVGRPVAVPIPVAPVVVWVMLVKAVLMHKVGVEDAALTVLSAEPDIALCALASIETAAKLLFHKSIEYTSPNVAVCNDQLFWALIDRGVTRIKKQITLMIFLIIKTNYL